MKLTDIQYQRVQQLQKFGYNSAEIFEDTGIRLAIQRAIKSGKPLDEINESIAEKPKPVRGRPRKEPLADPDAEAKLERTRQLQREYHQRQRSKKLAA